MSTFYDVFYVIGVKRENKYTRLKTSVKEPIVNNF